MSQVSAASSAAAAMAQASVTSANNTIQRKSPPKVFLDMGTDIGQALAAGMLATRGAVGAAWAQMARATIPSLGPTTGSYAPAGIGAPTMGGSGPVTINNNVTIQGVLDQRMLEQIPRC